MQSLMDQAASKSAEARVKSEPRATRVRNPYHACNNPRFWLLTRKLLAHEELLEKALRLADDYADPLGD
jgi:hypothetical protein